MVQQHLHREGERNTHEGQVHMHVPQHNPGPAPGPMLGPTSVPCYAQRHCYRGRAPHTPDPQPIGEGGG